MKKEYTGLDAARIQFDASDRITVTSTPCSKIYVTHFDQDPVDNQCDAPEQYDHEPESGATWTESWGDVPPD